MNTSIGEYNNGSSSYIMMSPDASILSKNSKAMAQLAPIEKPAIINTNVLGQGGGSKMNIPSIDQL